MNLHLTGKKAFISGSTQGIGYAIARQLLREDVEVVINGRHQEKTEQAAAKLRKEFPSAKVSAIAADFTKPAEVDALLKKLTDVDILVNNIGHFELINFEDLTDDVWYKYFELNVMSCVRLSRQLLPHMLKKKWGRMVFIGSESGVNVPENMIHYGMTKAAIAAVANGLSKLTKGTEVTINTILAGPTYSEGIAAPVEGIAKSQGIGTEQMKDSIIQQAYPHSLLQRFIEPDEIASLATYLCSPVSLATNGSSLRADGGALKVT